MKRTRTKKTPESSVGRELRKYVPGYRVKGLKEYAAAFEHAAATADSILFKEAALSTWGREAAKAGELSETELVNMTRVASPQRELEARVAALEEYVETLSESIADILASVKSIESEGVRAAPAPKPNGVSGPARPKPPRVSTNPGALPAGAHRILCAVHTRGEKGASFDELTAMVDLRETSLRTYISLLRTESLISTGADGRLRTTREGESVRGLEQLPVGTALYNTWHGRLSGGEGAVFRSIPLAQNRSRAVADLIGDATGLKETSVRTYVSSLVSRCLVVREGKGIKLAPILLDEA